MSVAMSAVCCCCCWSTHQLAASSYILQRQLFVTASQRRLTTLAIVFALIGFVSAVSTASVRRSVVLLGTTGDMAASSGRQACSARRHAVTRATRTASCRCVMMTSITTALSISSSAAFAWLAVLNRAITTHDYLVNYVWNAWKWWNTQHGSTKFKV